MLSKAIILILSAFLLSSCVTGPEGYFKKSANNKIFDRKGFVNSKRAPLYNKKFIAIVNLGRFLPLLQLLHHENLCSS